MSTAQVCIADDALRYTVEAALRTDGWTADSSADGAAGARALARSRPDLLILDATMPRFGSPDAAEAWADRVAPAVPLVLLVLAWDDHAPPRRKGTVHLPMPFRLEQFRAALVCAHATAPHPVGR